MITYYVACSLDGYIAGKNDDLDFLKIAEAEGVDYGYKDFYESLDMTVMGKKTWDMVKSFGKWPYPDKSNFVLTRQKGLEAMGNEEFVEYDAAYWKKAGKDMNIWLVGGGEVAKLFLNDGLIDKLMLTTVPVILGEGAQLFPQGISRGEWALEKAEPFKTGCVMTTYTRK